MSRPVCPPRWWLGLLLLMLLGLAACTEAPGARDGVAFIDTARARLEPEAGPPQQRSVRLRFRWDREFPGQAGRATFTVALPPATGAGPQALQFEYLANQALIRVNGQVVRRVGVLGNPAEDGGRMQVYVPLPASLVRADRPNELVVQASMQALRHGGLGELRFGPDAVLAEPHRQLRLRDETMSAAYAAVLLIVGGLSAALWWRQRDPVYGCFALASVLGIPRQINNIDVPVPLPWPWWGWLVAVCYGGQLLLTARFIFLVVDRDSRWLKRITYGVLTAALVLPTLSFALRLPLLWTVALGLTLAYGLGCFVIVLQQALLRRQPLAWLVLGAGTLMLLAGAHDFLWVRIGLAPASAAELVPHVWFGFVLLLAGIVVARYSRARADIEALNRTLAERVAERERQLQQAFDALQLQQQEQAVLAERQRIMREIHDGIGSQLVGLLGMVGGQAAPDRAELEHQVRLALDEMRMAVDSLQPVHNDLTTVLATLRYRLQPRLQAAGIAVVWDVAALPALPELTPHTILQLQRMLLEAFTNVLKHAGATQVTVSAAWQPGPPAMVCLSLQDNGRGFQVIDSEEAGTRGTRGHGITNMRARAGAIGARLQLQSAPGQGCRITIELPAGAADGS
ncbi:ATP-binding protein [Aquabacterium sp.]|uniref:sensor histidine kinase n=1 Tax=Aquabacterium sp. TaxID=1872578 RepID=UPI0037850F17